MFSRANIPGEPGVDYPIFSLCSINPRHCGGRSTATNNQNNRNTVNQGNTPQQREEVPLLPEVRRGKQNQQAGNNFRSDVAAGNIPGVPGKDYPIQSLEAFRRKFGPNAAIAPLDRIPADYPRDKLPGNGKRNNNGRIELVTRYN